MKRSILLLIAFTGGVILFSCRKENKEEPKLTINPSETAGPEASKVLHYNFNGTLNDGGGKALHGQSSPTNPISFTSDRFGRSNMALFLGDSGTVITPSLKAENIEFPFSISVWFNAPQVDSLQTIIQADAVAATSAGVDYLAYNGFYLQIGGTSFSPGNGRLSFTFGNNICGCPIGRTSILANNSITAGDWYHVVVNVFGPGENMEVYLNGVKQTNAQFEVGHTGSGAQLTWHSPGANIVGPFGMIGQNINPAFNYQRFVNGKVDDYRLFKKTLTATEVQSLYNQIP